MTFSLRHHPILRILQIGAAVLSAATLSAAAHAPPAAVVLTSGSFKHYLDTFNAEDDELYANAFPNARAWDFLTSNIPLVE